VVIRDFESLLYLFIPSAKLIDYFVFSWLAPNFSICRKITVDGPGGKAMGDTDIPYLSLGKGVGLTYIGYFAETRFTHGVQR
jgi:hypothetical protein